MFEAACAGAGRAVAGANHMTDLSDTVDDARRNAVRRMEKEHRLERLEYERKLERQGVPDERREELLAELRAKQRKRVRAFEREFDAAMRRVCREP